MKTALITGITGQDGFHPSELLLKYDYKIYGLLNGQRKSRAIEFSKKFPEIELIEGDLTDFSSLIRAVDHAKPDEIYNLGAISFVGLSFKQPELTANVTGLGPLRLLEAIRTLGCEKSVKFYQASSSEMFGKVQQVPQNEKTIFYPRSPYGVAKVYAHQICVNYRESYGMHVSCGILFNHEGPRRGDNFVTKKVVNWVVKFILWLNDNNVKNLENLYVDDENIHYNDVTFPKLMLGNLDSYRDWGYAGDYVEAMWRILLIFEVT